MESTRERSALSSLILDIFALARMIGGLPTHACRGRLQLCQGAAVFHDDRPHVGQGAFHYRKYLLLAF